LKKKLYKSLYKTDLATQFAACAHLKCGRTDLTWAPEVRRSHTSHRQPSGSGGSCPCFRQAVGIQTGPRGPRASPGRSLYAGRKERPRTVEPGSTTWWHLLLSFLWWQPEEVQQCVTHSKLTVHRGAAAQLTGLCGL